LVDAATVSAMGRFTAHAVEKNEIRCDDMTVPACILTVEICHVMQRLVFTEDNPYLLRRPLTVIPTWSNPNQNFACTLGISSYLFSWK